MRNVTPTFQKAHVLIDDKKWPVPHCARGGMNPERLASLIALTRHRASRLSLKRSPPGMQMSDDACCTSSDSNVCEGRHCLLKSLGG